MDSARPPRADQSQRTVRVTALMSYVRRTTPVRGPCVVARVARLSTPDGSRHSAQPWRRRLGAPRLLGPTGGPRRPINSAAPAGPRPRTTAIPSCCRAKCPVDGDGVRGRRVRDRRSGGIVNLIEGGRFSPKSRRASAFSQQAQVTASHSTNARVCSRRWCTARNKCRPTRKRFCTDSC